MLRALTVLALCALTTGAAPATNDKSLTIRWHGQSFFEVISSKGTRIVFDPHALEAYGAPEVEADLVLISHFHNDHTQTRAIKNLKKAKVLNGLKDERGDGKRVEWNPIDEKFKDVHVRNVGTYHDTMSGLQRGKNSVFLVEVDGLTICFLGDLGHELTESQVRKIGPVDIVMVPVGGIYTLNGDEAKKVVAQLKPTRYVIPMHYGTPVYSDLLSPDEFLDDQKNVKKFMTNELKVDPDVKPAEPVIAVLHYSDRVQK